MDTSNNRATLKQHLLISTIKYNIPFWHYKLLVEWLDCYDYILPAQRCLVIVPNLKTKPIHRATEIFQQAMLCDIIECCYSIEEQLSFNMIYNLTEFLLS